jgi:hypothetical protein
MVRTEKTMMKNNQTKKTTPLVYYVFITAIFISLAFLVLQSNKGQQWLSTRLVTNDSQTPSALSDFDVQVAELRTKIALLESRLEDEKNEKRAVLAKLDNQAELITRLTRKVDEQKLLAATPQPRPDKQDMMVNAKEAGSNKLTVDNSVSEMPTTKFANVATQANEQHIKRNQVLRLQSVMSQMELAALEALNQ